MSSQKIELEVKVKTKPKSKARVKKDLAQAVKEAQEYFNSLDRLAPQSSTVVVTFPTGGSYTYAYPDYLPAPSVGDFVCTPNPSGIMTGFPGVAKIVSIPDRITFRGWGNLKSIVSNISASSDYIKAWKNVSESAKELAEFNRKEKAERDRIEKTAKELVKKLSAEDIENLFGIFQGVKK